MTWVVSVSLDVVGVVDVDENAEPAAFPAIAFESMSKALGFSPKVTLYEPIDNGATRRVTLEWHGAGARVIDLDVKVKWTKGHELWDALAALGRVMATALTEGEKRPRVKVRVFREHNK